jgi:hypothetical protein
MELGRWADAEAVLVRARADFAAAMHTSSWHPDIALADLRTRQGRLAEAETLLLGKDQHMQALLPAARLHLARGDHDLARATALRGLRVVRGDRLRAVELLTVLVDAELAAGDVSAAAKVSVELTNRTADLPVAALRARAAAARARVLTAVGDVNGAVTTLENALEQVEGGQLLWLHATLLLDLAHARDQAGDKLGAVLEALATLDVVLAPADLALLERSNPGSASAASSRPSVKADQPLLFHTGPRGMFPLVAEAVAKVLPVESLRWITFGHVESDECGSMNMWLTAAPNSQVAHGALGCDVSLNDLAIAGHGHWPRAR